MNWVAVGWDANNVRYFLNGEGVKTLEFKGVTTFNHPGLAWGVVEEELTQAWAPNRPGIGPDPVPPAVARAKASELGEWIAVFTDPDRGEQYVIRADLPGFLTEDIEQAQRYPIEEDALALASMYVRGIVVEGRMWQPPGIASISARRID
ncbi:hypothetical protein AB0K52_15105 [Glycomyces sp. NPDC049804]|uniref:hypothetical protein n=1 Tax=Glycomyces sp. NPDC049804 TaxID=3154363 RepID=UPI003423C65C